MNRPLEKLTAVWKSVTKSGMDVLKGTLKEAVTLPAGTKLMVFPNKHKKGERDPDFQIMFSTPEVVEPVDQKPINMSDEEFYF